ncbi:MAG TPA: hypothetical protein VIH42_01930 [Thermoguttaceae bacterium]
MTKQNKKREAPKLFGPREDWQHNACINYAQDSWDLYAMGYKEAGNILVENIKVTQSHQDMLVYPIIYLYRQYLELRLKIILRDSRILLDENVDIQMTHNLNDLWGDTRKLIRIIFKGDDITPLNVVGKIIIEFNSMDPESMAFRYPVDKNGENLLPDIKHINIVQFQERFSEVVDLMEGVTGAVAEYISYKAEMNQNYY